MSQVDPMSAGWQTDNAHPGEALRTHLETVRRLRLLRMTEPAAADHLRLKAWQSARLARTHADLLADARYHEAARFFLDELYGTHDVSLRDAELTRIVPKLTAVLPERALATVAEAVRLDALSESLDADVVAQLRRAGRVADIDEAAYAAAYRACGRADERREQIALVDDIGRSLDRLTRLPLLATTLKLMRRPAEAAGLGALHRFLRQGFEAFRSMHGADIFLDTIRDRETALMQRWLAGG